MVDGNFSFSNTQAGRSKLAHLSLFYQHCSLTHPRRTRPPIHQTTAANPLDHHVSRFIRVYPPSFFSSNQPN
jgi:hypothetical protein